MESPESDDVFSESWQNCALVGSVKKLNDEQIDFQRENSVLSPKSTASNEVTITSSIKKENLQLDLVLCKGRLPIVVKTENDSLNDYSSKEDNYFNEESQNEVKFSPKSCVKIEPSITDSEEEESLITLKNSKCNEKATKEEYFVESKLVVQEELDIKDEDEAEDQFTAKSPIGQIRKWDHPSNKTATLNRKSTNNRRLYLTRSPIFKCLNCTYQTHRKENIARHVLSHMKKTLVCSHCSYRTWNKEYFRQHNLIHAPKELVKLHQCTECSYTSIRKSDLTQHMIKHTKADDAIWYQCPECPHKNKRLKGLTRHMLIHKKDAHMHKCTLCCYETSRKGDLTKHMRRTHSPKIIQLIHCQEEGCSYKTRHKSDLACHIRMIHKCKTLFKCPYQTKDASGIKIHELRNGEQNKLISSTLCPYRTTVKYDLNKHMVMHKSGTDIKWFHCSECPFKSKYNNSLKQHKLKHNLNPAKVFKCSECSFKTVRAQNFRDHRLVHKVTEWFYCYFCKWRTSRKYCLVKHIRRKHRGSDGRINDR